jgi:Cys-rich repeat protein
MSDGVCDSASYRCSHSGTAGADAGDPCTRDSQCEPDGVCLPESGGAWIGGYCTKFGCDVPGNACAGSGVCRDRRIGVSICTASCTVAAGGGTTPMEWIADRGGCRGGYMCAWDGVGTAGMAGNGHCLPGVFNAITTSNVGATCTTSGECYSPFGYGQCTGISAMGYCSVIDCGAPGVPAGVCGTGNECVTFGGGITACTEGCTTPDDCTEDVGCFPLGMGGAGPSVCVGCTDDTHCRAGRVCDAMPGFLGDCIPGLPP